MIGKTLAHYEILSALGKGGMGEVWRARDSTLGREVAIKTLPDEFASDEKRLARFEREAKLLASLNHPNIAAIYGLEQHEGTRFLVLELVEGDTLEDRIKQGPIPVEESLQLALQIAEALEAAHEKGVIHRDLKPANVKVTDDGTIKVLDFGLAKAFAEDESNANLSASPTLSMAATQQGAILGTAAYMSPEQAKGRATDKRADIWAFGSVLYEMLTGRPAFDGEDVSEVLASVIKGATNLDVLPAIHPVVRTVLARCMEKDPRKRFRDFGDVRVELEQALADPQGATAVISGPSPIKRTRMIPAIALTAILCIVFTGFAVWNFLPSEPRLVRRLDYDVPSDLVLRYAFQLLALSPDGTKLAFITDRGLYLRFLDRSEADLIQGTESELFITAPAFSPDGEWIAYWSMLDTQLKKVPANDGAPVFIADTPGVVFGLSWAPDGTILFGQPEGIFRVSEDGGTPELIVAALDGESLDRPQLLPGGEYVLFTTTQGQGPLRWDEARIVAQSLDTGDRQFLADASSGYYVPTGHLIYVQGDVVYARTLDPSRLEETGGALSVIEGVARSTDPENYGGTAHLGYSGEGSLVYLTGVTGNENRVLAVVDRNGVVERLPVAPRSYQSPRVSPDGSRVAVQATVDGQNVIWTYDLSGTTAMQRLTLEGNNYRPVWTPDGNRIAFASDREGAIRIYLQAADGSGVAERLTTPEEGTVHWPEAWSPDGRTLAYKVEHPRGGNNLITNEMDLWAVTLDGEGRPGEPEPLSVIPYPSQEMGAAFSPDGRWVAYGSGRSLGLEFEVYVEPFPQPAVADVRFHRRGD